MRALAVTLIVLCVQAQPAEGQTARSGGGTSEQSAQLVQQLQQLGAERTALQAENAKLKSELEGLRKERDTLKSGQQGLGARAKASEVALTRAAKERESSEQEVTQLTGRMQELVGKFRETAQSLKDVETDRTAMKQSLVARNTELTACVDKNKALYTLNAELLTRMEDQSVWSSVARAEPFTRLKRIELENLADAYQDRAQQQRVASP